MHSDISFSKNRRQKGFTLIELAIVVVILGVILTILAKNMTGNSDNAIATSVYSNSSKIIDSWTAININAGTRPAFTSSGESSFINSSGNTVSPQSSGIGGSTNDRNGLLDLVVNGALTEDASGNLQVEFIPDGTVMVNESTSQTASARVEGFKDAGIVALSNSVNYDSASGYYNIEGIQIDNVYSPNRSTMRIVFKDMDSEICKALVKKSPSSRIFSGTSNGGTSGDLAGETEGCGSSVVIPDVPINFYI